MSPSIRERILPPTIVTPTLTWIIAVKLTAIFWLITSLVKTFGTLFLCFRKIEIPFILTPPPEQCVLSNVKHYFNSARLAVNRISTPSLFQYVLFSFCSLLESGETVCPMCSQSIAASEVKQIKDPAEYLKTDDKE